MKRLAFPRLRAIYADQGLTVREYVAARVLQAFLTAGYNSSQSVYAAHLVAIEFEKAADMDAAQLEAKPEELEHEP